MKTVDPVLSNAIRTSYNVTAVPRVIADWNMNRYYTTTVDNTPLETNEAPDPDIFPITSIVEPLRPTKGINKARVNEGIISPGYMDPNVPRFYMSSVDDKYKYWQAPFTSDSTGAITGCQPYVIYSQNLDVNKIRILFENSWASPNSYVVEVTTNGTTWSTVSTSPPISNDGSVNLYWNGTAWSTTKPAVLTALRNIRGVRLTVNSLTAGRTVTGAVTTYNKVNAGGTGYTTMNTDGKNSHFSLISLGAHLEVDLSDRVISTGDTFDMGDSNQITPLGTITTNTSDLTLWNGDNLFSNDNPSSMYKGLIEGNVRINCEYVYTIAGTKYYVQQWVMYTGPWEGQSNDSVSLSLQDYSKHFQEAKPNEAMYENCTLPEIVYRLCDSVGFVNYVVDTHPALTDYRIPVFWIDGTKTLWEIFDDLATQTQSAIYFDAFNKLRIRTRDAAFNTTRSVDWTLRGVGSGAELADIVELNQSGEFESNKVKVTYTPTTWSDWNNGLPAMQTVWEPEGDVVLRASNLRISMTTTSNTFVMNTSDAAIWPYSGMVNIEGELIRYSKKRFVYWTGSDGMTQNVVDVKDQDEHDKYNAMSPPAWRYKNSFNGTFIIDTEPDGSLARGQWNSMVRDHNVDAVGYTPHSYINGVYKAATGGFTFNASDSSVTLTPVSKVKKSTDYTFVTHGDPLDSTFYNYGTRVQIVSGSGMTTQTAGIVMNNSGTNESGYYVELTPTNKLGAKERKYKNEVQLYVRKSNKRISMGKGAKMAIVPGINYDIDVRITDDHYVRVWVNGKLRIQKSIPSANRLTLGGQFGMYIRGKTKATYSYLYGIARDVFDGPDADMFALPDDFSYYDRLNGGVMGGAWDQEWVYGWREASRRVKNKTVKYQQLWNRQFFDEFGPIIHEVREFDVNFDPAPVLHSRLFSTNDVGAVCVEYRSTPFGAKFIIANISRNNAVLNGEDSLAAAGSDETVDQVLNVIGRAMVNQDEASVEAKNDAQIRMRGEIQSDVTGEWIQTKEAADALALWIKNHWSTGLDELTVTIFGNPLIECGDLLAIEYPKKNMTTATHKYFVTGVNNTFETGITTELTLRRALV